MVTQQFHEAPEVTKYNFHQPVAPVVESPQQWRARRPWSVTASCAMNVAAVAGVSIAATMMLVHACTEFTVGWSIIALVWGITEVSLTWVLWHRGRVWAAYALGVVAVIGTLFGLMMSFSATPTGSETRSIGESIGNTYWPSLFMVWFIISCWFALIVRLSRDWYDDSHLAQTAAPGGAQSALRREHGSRQ